MSPPIDGMASDKLSQSSPGERCHSHTLHLPLQPLPPLPRSVLSLWHSFTSLYPSIRLFFMVLLFAYPSTGCFTSVECFTDKFLLAVLWVANAGICVTTVPPLRVVTFYQYTRVLDVYSRHAKLKLTTCLGVGLGFFFFDPHTHNSQTSIEATL